CARIPCSGIYCNGGAYYGLDSW
nr:immunoglobulin heavy chain junction region [Macaca mulatta]